MKRGRPRHDDILTPREWEVLDLLRSGLSNEQIADRLGISRNTTKFHVSEILSKLGVSSRGEAARWQPQTSPWLRGAVLTRLQGLKGVAMKTAYTLPVVFGLMLVLLLVSGLLVMNSRQGSTDGIPKPVLDPEMLTNEELEQLISPSSAPPGFRVTTLDTQMSPVPVATPIVPSYVVAFKDAAENSIFISVIATGTEPLSPDGSREELCRRYTEQAGTTECPLKPLPTVIGDESRSWTSEAPDGEVSRTDQFRRGGITVGMLVKGHDQAIIGMAPELLRSIDDRIKALMNTKLGVVLN